MRDKKFRETSIHGWHACCKSDWKNTNCEDNDNLFNNRMSDMTSCTGTIIDQKNILTADHCVLDRKKSNKDTKVALEPSQISVIVGQTRIAPAFNFLLGRNSLKVSKITRYQEDGKKDIAIVTLEKPLKFSSSISPICVPKDYQANFTEVVAAGWGDVSDSGSKLLSSLDMAWDLRESTMLYLNGEYFGHQSMLTSEIVSNYCKRTIVKRPLNAY